MADIEKVRVGDTLRFNFERMVSETDPAERTIRLDDFGWISTDFIWIAEHIPAPKVFKRGDWVRSTYSATSRHGLVTGVSIKNPSRVWVTWPENEGSRPIDIPACELDYDEAPKS